MKQPSTHCLRQREQGFSLITTLVLLVIASLLGVAASQLVLMSERSSRYDRDRLIAFQAAEAALLDAELDIRGPGSIRAALFSPLSITGFEDGCSTSSASRGMCLPSGPGEKPVWATVNFADTDRTVELGAYTGRKYAAGKSGVQPARAPRYLIEVIEDPSPGGDAAATRHLYRVSAVGFGPREETQVMLQMFFRKE